MLGCCAAQVLYAAPGRQVLRELPRGLGDGVHRDGSASCVRDAGFLAQNSAIASGAEAAIIPEDSTDVDQLAQFMERGIRKSKKSCIVIVSESPKCGALYYADRVRKEFPEFDVRVSILGHLQRGGRPSARDRILASRTGCGAIEAIMQGQRNVMIGVRNNEVVYVPLSEAIRSDKPFDRKLIKVLDELSI